MFTDSLRNRLPLLALLLLLLPVSCLKDEEIISPGAGEENASTDWKAATRYVFDPTVIPEIHISVSLEEWNRLLAAYDADAGTVEYIHCDARYVKGNETTSITDAGLRLKGNTSRRRPEGSAGEMHGGDNADWHHFHMGLNFRLFVEDKAHTVHGIRQVYLKWFKDDPAYCRELYCYDLFRRFGVWTAVNDVYARVWIRVAGDTSETYLGVYEMLEQLDRNYLKVREEQFGSIDGNLWKCRWNTRLNSTDDGLFGIDDNDSSHPPYELKTNTRKDDLRQAAFNQIKDFILKVRGKTGESFRTWISTVTDVDLLLKTYAVSVAVGMRDDYWNNCNNYYLYFDSSDKYDYHFWFIPYDYDNTLGTSLQCGSLEDSGRQDLLHWGNDDNPLIAKILSYPEWREAYVGYLKELVAGEFSYNASTARIRSWQAEIASYVRNDTGEDMIIEDRPAPWGNHGEYRLLQDGSDNFFQVKAGVVNVL